MPPKSRELHKVLASRQTVFVSGDFPARHELALSAFTYWKSAGESLAVLRPVVESGGFGDGGRHGAHRIARCGARAKMHHAMGVARLIALECALLRWRTRSRLERNP